jgi:hypothetical protein
VLVPTRLEYRTRNPIGKNSFRKSPFSPRKRRLLCNWFSQNREFPRKTAVYPLEKVVKIRISPGKRAFSSRAIIREQTKTETTRGGRFAIVEPWRGRTFWEALALAEFLGFAILMGRLT